MTRTKRVFDILISSAALLALLPLFVIVALAICLQSPGHILYVQPRLGQGNRIFKCYKFRTMLPGSEKRLEELLALNPRLRIEWERKQKLQRDPRVFPVGRVLRKLSLDELPQLWNVLLGDLSLVGPRPYMLDQLSRLGPYASKILSIRPGLTGLWQTSGRSRTSFQRRVALDAEYVDKNSFWFDLRILFRTIPEILFPKNAS